MDKLIVRQAAVLGAGVMGAQIAAHLANAGIPVLLFDLTPKDGPRHAIAERAIEGLKKLEPAPLALTSRAGLITPANYDDDSAALRNCDLVIEAIAERLDWKLSLYERVAPNLGAHTLFATNTSGLSINTLADALPAKLRPRFCGIHFFNPPRYMRLIELIPARASDPAILDQLESWLTTRLGKGVVRALDTPNFIGNRIGVFAILAGLHHADALGLKPDDIDAITGPAIGRPKSATYRTADVVGLDTLAHVVETMDSQLPDDPWHSHFQLPDWMKQLIAKGALGQKSGAGVYRKEGKTIQVLDTTNGQYRDAAGKMSDAVTALLAERDPATRLRSLRESKDPQAQFLWRIFRDVFHYSAYHLASVADNARDLDLAIRWGFGWKQGPFESWQESGWREVAQAIDADIKAGLTLAPAPLPAWALEAGRQGVHQAEGSYSAADGKLHARSALPVYQRQYFPERVAGENITAKQQTLWENDGVRLWRLDEADAGIAVLSITSKMHAIGDEVLEGILDAVAEAESHSDGIVLWHEAPFSVGANLKQVLAAAQAGKFDELESMLARFQQVSLALHYAQIPVVAAVQGMALGGGCEFALHAAHRVLALESHIGLVEAGVGLIPAGGGSTFLAQRAARLAATTDTPNEVLPYIQRAFQAVAQAKVSRSALEAITMGYARSSDTVLFHPGELLYAGIQAARGLADAGYTPPVKRSHIPVAGRAGLATLETALLNLREGGQISAHDYRVARGAAEALCGGDVDGGTLVDEDWLLAQERRIFLDLLHTPETLARIEHTMKTGKPLRN